MNPQNGLKIVPCRELTKPDRRPDTELLKLTAYLIRIKDDESLSGLNHKRWKSMLKRRREGGVLDDEDDV